MAQTKVIWKLEQYERNLKTIDGEGRSLNITDKARIIKRGITPNGFLEKIFASDLSKHVYFIVLENKEESSQSRIQIGTFADNENFQYGAMQLLNAAKALKNFLK